MADPATDPGKGPGVGRDYRFPFTPYGIQADFMDGLYDVLEDGRQVMSATEALATGPRLEDEEHSFPSIGIFESPTGTGKTLSLLSATLCWLSDARKAGKDYNPVGGAEPMSAVQQVIAERVSARPVEADSGSEALPPGADDGGQARKAASNPSWVDDWFAEEAKREEEEARAELARKRVEYRKRLTSSRDIDGDRSGDGGDGATRSRKQSKTGKRAGKGTAHGPSSASSSGELVLSDAGGPRSDLADDLSSDGGEEGSESRRWGRPKAKKSVAQLKILFTSRTHSQLAQVISEFKKTEWASEEADIKMIVLASRRSLCVNPAVQALSSGAAMNDKCRQLNEKACGCKWRDPTRVKALARYSHVAPLDIEDLVAAGRARQACPYYASRAAVRNADVVLLPYASLVHPSTRSTLDIPLAGNVVIVDEAHNITDAITAAHSATLSGQQIADATALLNAYHERYKNKLSPANAGQIVRLLRFLAKIDSQVRTELVEAAGGTSTAEPGGSLQQTPKKSGELPATAISVQEFEFRSKTDNFPALAMANWLEAKRLAHKVRSFSERRARQAVDQAQFEAALRVRPGDNVPSQPGAEVVIHGAVAGQPEDGRAPSATALFSVTAFLQALSRSAADGHIVIRATGEGGIDYTIKYLLLNPTAAFGDVLAETRSVVFAGGTLAPTSDFTDGLCGGIPASRVTHHSFDHVVPRDNFVCLTLGAGPTGKPLKLTYANRNRAPVLKEMGMLLRNVCNVTPGGVVVFFASYAYQEMVVRAWQESGLLDAISKEVFVERRSGSQPSSSSAKGRGRDAGGDPLEAMLAAYGEAVESGDGAVLLCVIGGKLSEGINFGDALGRCVVVFGLPYPNQTDVELQLRLRHLRERASGAAEQRAAQEAEAAYQDNVTMKAVNQSIGRAIRHANDYAAILLVDERYRRASIRTRIPQWIQASLEEASNFGSVIRRLATFFRSHRPSTAQ